MGLLPLRQAPQTLCTKHHVHRFTPHAQPSSSHGLRCASWCRLSNLNHVNLIKDLAADSLCAQTLCIDLFWFVSRIQAPTPVKELFKPGNRDFPKVWPQIIQISAFAQKRSHQEKWAKCRHTALNLGHIYTFSLTKKHPPFSINLNCMCSVCLPMLYQCCLVCWPSSWVMTCGRNMADLPYLIKHCPIVACYGKLK